MTKRLTSSHWGIGVVETKNGQITSVDPHPTDPDPSPLNTNIAESLTGRARVLRPAVRQGWLNGRASERGRDAYVEVSWDKANDLIATELKRVINTHGNRAIFAGSYGWASAGRFHHAQSQLKRFLNCLGGFVRSEGNYSYNAALVAMPHIVGGNFRTQLAEATRWSVIAKHAELVVLFGGLPMRNMQISDGGAGRHRMSDNLDVCRENNVRFINLSPLKSDTAEKLNAEWLTPKPGTDTAVMMGLAHTLLEEGLQDQKFLDAYTVGFEKFAAYLAGETDGVPKDANWAAERSGLSATRLRKLAREMADKRTMISCVAGIQRADWGEQPLWMTVTLAAMLGQIGLPGGGYTIGYGVNAHVGNMNRPFPTGGLSQGTNPVQDYIPVAMISDMLLNPGAPYRYDGETRTLPNARLVWWAGGNPFHHHQDLNRMRTGFQTPDTVIVNEMNWTATARHADIVLPIAAAQERNDFGAGNSDNILVPMPKHTEPPGEAREEFEVYATLADRLDCAQAFTEGRDTEAWLRHLWEETQSFAKDHGTELPEWEAFLKGDPIELPDPTPDQVFLENYRRDPKQHPRQTPSGKIELFSNTVAGFELPECPGHATWNEPHDFTKGLADTYPLALISGQPRTRLHSQFDNGAYSLGAKVNGREPVLIHPEDAALRGISDGDVVELFNDRGRCLAGARVTEDVMQGVVFLWTGAWYDPDFDAPAHRDRHGNPNVLTHDLRTSEFSQSPSAHSSLVEVRHFSDPLPKVQAHDPPVFVTRSGGADDID